MKTVLYIAAFAEVLNYMFWQEIENYLGFHIFESVNAFFICVLCTFILSQNKSSFIAFFLFCASLNNFVDEAFNVWEKICVSEMLLFIIIPILWFVKSQRNVRKDTRDRMVA